MDARRKAVSPQNPCGNRFHSRNSGKLGVESGKGFTKVASFIMASHQICTVSATDRCFLLPNTVENRPVSFRSFTVAWLIAAFLISLYGRVEPELNAGSLSLMRNVSSNSANNETSPMEQRSGDHKDLHGCYHSHAPFTVAAASFTCQLSFSFLTVDLFSLPSLLSFAGILHPPRA